MKRLLGNLAVLGLMMLAISVGRPALAFEFDIGGERKANLNGFYEMRLLFLGEDFPSNGATFSQFRHVLNIEAEVEIFPEGWGPFDFMMAFSRVVFTYECIYDRACGLAKSADSFGGDRRSINRLPKNLKEAMNQPLDVGSVFRINNRPGAPRIPIQQVLNPSQRYRDCFLDPGDIALNHPNGLLAAFCNIHDRSRLDGPIDEFTGQQDLLTRAGSLNTSFRFNYLRAARPQLEGTAAEDPSSFSSRFEELSSLLVSGAVLDSGQLGVFRGLNQAAGVAGQAADAAEREGDAAEREGDAVRAALLRERSAQLRERSAQLAIEAIDYLEENSGDFDHPDITEELIGTRPDSSIFQKLARARAPFLLESQWGSNKLDDWHLVYLASLGADIEPLGYFGSAPLDLVDELAAGVASSLGKNFVGAPDTLEQLTSKTALRRASIPFFVGPDGLRNSPDDLPSLIFGSSRLGLVAVEGTGYEPVDEDGKPLLDPNGIPVPSDFDDVVLYTLADGSPVELYGRFKNSVVVKSGCDLVGGTFDPDTDTCTVAGGTDVTAEVFVPGCRKATNNNRSGGINQDAGTSVDGSGRCVELRPFRAKAPFQVLDGLSDLMVRPGQAGLEPVDLTDFKQFATARQSPPARPRHPDGGVYFQHKNLQNLVATSSRLVSSLDAEFSEDRLRWGWGANEDEGAFREGYLEFEMADSQVFARIGKLILVWGKTELFRNQDRMNPLDFSNGVVTRLEESRIGQWMVDVVFSPEAWMRVGPVEDMRLEFAVIFDNFQGTDLGVAGENSALALISLKSFGAMASGLAGLGLVGEVRPDREYSGLKQFDYGVRLEGRWDRFTFAITDFWGWDDTFYPDLVVQYGRRVDPDTGAPVNATGPLSCKYRAANGSATGDVRLSVGPDNVPDTDDDVFPTVGNCLLWDDPAPGVPQQTIRASGAVALNHSVNQTLFHTICTLTFDEDRGFCLLDQLNHPEFFGFVSELLVGNALIGELAIDGVQRIRTGATPYSNLIPTVVELAFQGTARLGKPQGDLGNLSVEQQALLGCGPAFSSPCGIEQKRDWVGDVLTRTDTSIGDAIERDLSEISGGMDLMNADASMVTMEFSLLREGSPNAIVGTRSDLLGNQRFEAGVKTGGMTVNDVIALGNDGRTEFVRLQNEIAALNFRHTVILDNDDPNHNPDFDTAGNPGATRPVATDAWIEPFPWLPDPNLLAQRILVYQMANRFELDPRCHLVEGQEEFFNPGANVCRDEQGNRIAEDIFNSPFDRTNPLNVFRTDANGEVVGESCIAGFRFGFDAGCTDLEDVSNNFERLTMALEIVGNDRVPDPPESLQELLNVMSDNFLQLDGFSTPTSGDPIAGPDGIFAANFASGLGNLAVADTDLEGRFEQDLEFGDEVDIQVVRLAKAKQATTTTIDLRTLEAKEAFMASALVDCPAETSNGICYARVGDDTPFPLQGFDNDATDATLPLVAVLPATLPVVIDDFLFGHVNFLKLYFQNPDLAMQLLDPLIPFIVLDLEDGTTAKIFLNGVNPLVQFFGNQSNSVVLADCQNLDDDEKCDWDQDSDFVYDGADDYTRGPATDDNLFCGSGIPGDVLQDALQKEFARPSDELIFGELFPGGLPPRSPVFCRSTVGLLNATGLTLPIRRAGGDGQFGRRDFLWSTGRQITLNYQKRNVLGFSLDFAEDFTKTSWGIEFTWTANKLFPDLNSFSGLNKSDEMILSISVDRPTFFNFLNPNRSFFLNFQFFIRYLDDFKGGSDDQDGMFGVAEGPFDGRMVFTFFTGYFQDRLQPQTSIVYDPTTSNGGVLARVSYRWTEAFSTTVGINSFFGRPTETQQAYFPIAPRIGTADLTTESFRSIAPVRNRDSGWITVRFSW